MKWISVKDKLPEQDQEVLAFALQSFLENHFIEGRFIEKCIYYPNKVRDGWIESPWVFNEHCCRDYLINVTHWMPLPEEPKED